MRIECRLNYLEKWRELAIRPLPEECHDEDRHMLTNDVDDLQELSRKVLDVRKEMNKNLPLHEQALDLSLVVKKSAIKGAGLGLYFMPQQQQSIIRSGSTICYYTGWRHNFHSIKSVTDKSYVLCVHSDLLVDPGPLKEVKARYINDPLNTTVENCRFEPQPEKYRCAVTATKNIYYGEELFVSYGDYYWSNQKQSGTIYHPA
jgi:hypothetical protein